MARFQQGQSGNPGGRPRESVTSALRALLRQKGPDGKPNRARVAQELLDMALTAESEGIRLDAIREIFNRIDGKIAESVNLGGSVDVAIREIIAELPADLVSDDASD